MPNIISKTDQFDHYVQQIIIARKSTPSRKPIWHANLFEYQVLIKNFLDSVM